MTDETVFRIIIAAQVIVSLGISGYFRRRADRAAGEKISRRQDGGPIMIGLAVGGLALWISTALYVINPQWMAWSSLSLPNWLRWAGAGLSLTATPLLYWVMNSLGNNVTPTSATRRNHTLVTHGPYRWVRHPLYAVGTTSFIGISLMAANGFIALMSGLAIIALAVRTPIEEARLIEKFGDEYRAYMRRTGRFLPRLLR